jgi:hypothetical protein
MLRARSTAVAGFESCAVTNGLGEWKNDIAVQGGSCSKYRIIVQDTEHMLAGF